jgi:NAD(P)-dependent dehydrogenase (short-subunit alcohol dehydrogenase family)
MADIGRLLRIEGKIALVTGGGRGIGRAVCELFAEAGARVAVCDIDGASATTVAQSVDTARAYNVDISDEEAVVGLFDAIQADFGALDILVHVAAIFPKRDFLEMTAAQWDALHAVNTRGTFLVMREAVKAMKASVEGGAIVNVSSVSGERAVVTHNSAYSASKAAVTNLTRSVAIEVAASGIRVNAVLPGGVATEGAGLATEAMKASGLQIGGPMTMPGRLPMARMATPDEIANACLFLASPAASYITGHALAVDGGFLVS